jgi:hypothetical protein
VAEAPLIDNFLVEMCFLSIELPHLFIVLRLISHHGHPAYIERDVVGVMYVHRDVHDASTRSQRTKHFSRTERPSVIAYIRLVVVCILVQFQPIDRPLFLSRACSRCDPHNQRENDAKNYMPVGATLAQPYRFTHDHFLNAFCYDRCPFCRYSSEILTQLPLYYGHESFHVRPLGHLGYRVLAGSNRNCK